MRLSRPGDLVKLSSTSQKGIQLFNRRLYTFRPATVQFIKFVQSFVIHFALCSVK